MFIMENNEKIKLMNNLGQEKLELITNLLLRGCSYDEISELTGVEICLLNKFLEYFYPKNIKLCKKVKISLLKFFKQLIKV